MPEPVETLYVALAADASRLTSDVEKAVKTAEGQLQKVDKATQETGSGFMKLGTLIQAAFALAIVQKFLGVLQKVGTALVGITKQAVGFASSMQGVNILFVKLLGSQAKATEFMTEMRKQAAITGQSVVEMAMGSKRFLPYAEGNKEAFMDMVRAAQALAAADPFQGMMGAGMALEEFLSGTAGSLAMRFELPRKKLTEIAKMEGTIAEKMKALNVVLKEHGKGWDLVEAQIDTFAGQMGFLKGLWSEVLLEYGKPIFAEVETGLKEVVAWVKENREEIIILAQKFGDFVADAIGGIKSVVESLSALGAALDSVMTSLVGPTWFDEWMVGVRRLGALIEVSILDSLNMIAETVTFIGTNIHRIAQGETKLMSLREYLARRQIARKETMRGAFERWGLATRKKEEAPPTPTEEEAEEVGPPGLSEKAQKAALKGAKKIEDIIKDFQKRVTKLRGDYAKKLLSIQNKAIKAREKALEKAQKSEADAVKDYQKDVQKIRADYNTSKIDEQEDFNREWKRLIRDQHQAVIDAEWEFQYAEEKLIAEGDTLALRDLRIRYGHEKELRAREQDDARSDMQSDRSEQRQDRERDFREEISEREGQFRERMSEIQTQLHDQIATIAENAAEARAKEQENYAERHADLVASRDEKLQAVGEGLMSEKEMNTATANEIMALWAEVYGPEYMAQVQQGIDADRARKESLGLLEEQALETAAALEAAATAGGGDPWSVARARGRQYAATGRRPYGRGEVEFAQHGLDEVFSRPTTLVVGEGGVAEHVRVTPLTGGAGGGGGRRLAVDLSGNITVSGSALSPEAANMLIIKMSEAVVEGIARRPE